MNDYRMKMKGFCVTGPRQGSVIETDVPVLSPGQALIEVEYAGICGGDPKLFALNTYGATPENPIIYGHEFVGIVKAISNPYQLPSRIKIGDRVVAHQDRPCNVCIHCISGKPSICSAEYGKRKRSDGCFAEYLTRDLPYIFPIKEGVSSLVATLAEPLAVAVYDIRQSQLEINDCVLIIGGGTIGILIGLVARLTGITNILFCEISEPRIALLKEMGFNAIHPVKDSVPTALHKYFGRPDVDCVFEVSGAQNSYDLALQSVATKGKIVFVALPAEVKLINFNEIYSKQIHVVSVNSHQLDDFSKAVEIINSGVADDILSRMVTNILPLDRLMEAYALSKDKNGLDIKILVDCRQASV